MPRRPGITTNYLTRITIIFILILAVLSMGKPASNALGEGLTSEYAKIDRQRTYGPFMLMAGEGSGSMHLSLSQEYNGITIEDNELTLDHDDITSEDQEPIRLPEKYSYDNQFDGGQELCVTKQGMQFTLESGSCEETTCENADACSAWTPEDRTRMGYYCTGGAYTKKGFFEHYYSSDGANCDGREGNFAEINRLVCPDEVQDSDAFGCLMEFSYSCMGTGVQASLSGGSNSHSQSFSCDEGVGHNRIYLRFDSISQDTEISGSLSGSGADSMSATVEVYGG